MTEPIFYVEAFQNNNPSVRAKIRQLLVKSGHTGLDDHEAWKIVETEFLEPYEDRIYPREYRRQFETVGMPMMVGDDDVVSLIMNGCKRPGWW